jgi:hypothetical protein
MIIKIYANDGKEFKGNDYTSLVNELNAYEADQKLKKQKEEAERKVAEEKKMKLTQYRNTKLKEINDILQKSKVLVDDYEKTTGNKLIYTNDLSTGNIAIKEVRNSIDYAWDDVIGEILKAFRTK